MVFLLVLRLRVARYLRNHLCTLVCTFDLRNLAYFIVQDRLSCPLNTYDLVTSEILVLRNSRTQRLFVSTSLETNCFPRRSSTSRITKDQKSPLAPPI
jgi:hypothetical protein